MTNAELIAQIQSQIDALSDTTSLDNLVLLSVAVDNATSDRIITVATVSALPDLKTANVQYGTIFFVEEYNIPVIAGTKSWLGLDGRLIRTDVPNYNAWSWGSNGSGQLGDNTAASKSSPISVVGDFNNWVCLVGTQLSSAGLLSNGTIWTWGSNSVGQLGNGDIAIITTSSPIAVVGGFTDWCEIGASSNHVGAIRCNGTAWAWGCNSNGQLGDGTTINRSSPVSVVGGFTDWRKITGTLTHSLALRANGTIWAWGYNSTGSLGDGTVANRSSPVSVVGGFTDWCAISSLSGIRTNGTLWSWGSGTSLADGTTLTKSSPVSVVGGFTDWCGVSTDQLAGKIAIRTNGTIWSWGTGCCGKLGDGTTVAKSSPVSVVGGFTDWCGIATMQNSAVGIRTNGTAWSWGINISGRLGDGTVVNRCSPVSVVGGFTNWCKIGSTGGGAHGIGIVAV